MAEKCIYLSYYAEIIELNYDTMVNFLTPPRKCVQLWTCWK